MQECDRISGFSLLIFQLVAINKRETEKNNNKDFYEENPYFHYLLS